MGQPFNLADFPPELRWGPIPPGPARAKVGPSNALVDLGAALLGAVGGTRELARLEELLESGQHPAHLQWKKAGAFDPSQRLHDEHGNRGGNHRQRIDRHPQLDGMICLKTVQDVRRCP